MDKRCSMLLAVMTIPAGVMWTAGCGTTKPVQAKTTEAPIPVSVVQVTKRDLSKDLELSAEFRAYQEIDVYAKVAGYVKAIHVDVGDRVRQGQAIAELEVPEMAQELAQASAAERRSELEVERARGEVRRAENALQIRKLSFGRLSSVVKARPNLVAQQELDDASARYEDAGGQLMAAKAALAASEEQVRAAEAYKARVQTMISYLKITAPFAGVITNRLADPGAMIQAGIASHSQAMPVVRLSQIDHLRLVLPVPESIVGGIRLGAPVEVRVDSLNRIFQGRVSRFSRRLDSSTRTMETEVDLPNTDGSLMPGMYGYARLRLERKMDVLTAPVRAIFRGNGTPSVMLVTAHNQVEERPVVLGMETPDAVEIRSGLQAGDQIVFGSRSRLKAGMRVEPKLMAERAHAGTAGEQE